MDILTKIEEIANKGLAINYDIVDQEENGYKKVDPSIPLKTYTVHISEISNFNDPIEYESFNSLKDGLKYFIKYAEECLTDWDGNVIGCKSEDGELLCVECGNRNLRYHCYSFRKEDEMELVKKV